MESPEGTYYYHKGSKVSRWEKPEKTVTSKDTDTERSADIAFKVRLTILVISIYCMCLIFSTGLGSEGTNGIRESGCSRKANGTRPHKGIIV